MRRVRHPVPGCTPAPALRVSQGGNLESPGSTCNLVHANDQVNVSAASLNLGALGDHGGPTQTIPVMSPSAAISAAVGCPPPATDQRGVTRPQGPGCDSGAYEAEVAVPLGGLGWLAIALAAAGARALRRTPAPRADGSVLVGGELLRQADVAPRRFDLAASWINRKMLEVEMHARRIKEGGLARIERSERIVELYES